MALLDQLMGAAGVDGLIAGVLTTLAGFVVKQLPPSIAKAPGK